jgi:Arc/MetJ-type ribon-helix-helix transcriptional regulator
VDYNTPDNRYDGKGGTMKTIRMTIDEPLLIQVDQAIQALNTTRSAFIREAILLALRQQKTRKLEQQQAEGYTRHPVEPGEFDIWESEQVWGAA